MQAYRAFSDASVFTENDSSKTRPLLVWLVVAMLACLLTGSILLAPVALAHGRFLLALSIYRGFSFACHQMPARSFFVENYPLAVCARCTGLYAGFAAGALLYPLVRDVRKTFAPSRVWLLAALVPVAIDWALGFFGIWNNTHLSRCATGALLGAVSALYVLPGLIDLSRNNPRGFPARLSSSNERGVRYEQQ